PSLGSPPSHGRAGGVTRYRATSVPAGRDGSGDRMGPAKLDVTAVIPSPPRRVMKAFFDAETLHAWWKVSHSVTCPERLACTRSSVRRSLSTTKFSAALAACPGDRGEMPGPRRS